MVQYIGVVSRNFNFCDTQRESQYQCTKNLKKVNLVLLCKALAHKPKKINQKKHDHSDSLNCDGIP